jgi:alpha-galactosidase
MPASLRLDPATGIVSGATPGKAGESLLTLRAWNSHGAATRYFKIVVGDTLALTPPMGWNDWYTHYDRVTADLIRRAASSMVSSGMADFGYQYVNIDDWWMVKPGYTDPDLGGEPRGADGSIRPNGRFPDMKGLTTFIHSYGLKAGIYSSPGPLTCAQFAGSYGHEEADARKFAEWGFDFLKYDWCSYGRVASGTNAQDRKRPYELMGSILAQLDRGIVFNLCQYGMDEVWKWVAPWAATAGAPRATSAWKRTHAFPAFTPLRSKTPSTPNTPVPATGTTPITFSSARWARLTAPGTRSSPPRSPRTSNTATCRCGL